MREPKIRVGYACINLSLTKKYKTFRLKTLQDKDIKKIQDVIQNNIILFGDIIHHNIKNNIYVYRLTSDVIPFASHIEMQCILEEYGLLEDTKLINELKRIKALQEQYKLRISMHPSQFTVLNSPKEQVIKNAIAEIKWQSELMHKVGGKNIIIHLGGAYGNKQLAKQTFKNNFLKYRDVLDASLITLENDDKIYTSEDIVEVCKELNLKWVYDFHHERCNPSQYANIIELLKTHPPDKYHLSTGIEGAYKPPHADYIIKEDYRALLNQMEKAHVVEADIMFEAKKKNLAITQILNPISNGYWILK